MSQPYSSAARVIQILEQTGARQVITFITKDRIVKATRHSKPRRGDRSSHIVVSYGKPNNAERRLIKTRLKIGAPFPVTKSRRYTKK